jgi:hypothetical protein
MVTDRLFEQTDFTLLAESLTRDPFHTTTTPEFFSQPGTICKVYQDEAGPILFVRGSKSLRLDIQFVSNDDIERNRKAMLDGFLPFAEKAKQNGFTEIVFNTDNPLLERFCIKRLGFQKVFGTELRKFL